MSATTQSLIRWDLRRDLLICFLLLAATVGVYWSVCNHEFTNYDDPLYVTENVIVQGGLTAAGVAWAFDRVVSEQRNYWHPVTWLSHMLDCQLFGVNPGAHHLMNLAFHAANVLLLYFLLKRMTGCAGRSAAVAALFALHPLQVDTVAWIAERKNVLSTLFWLLTMLAYVRYARRPGVVRYLPVFFLFALGLMCKPMLVTVPCVLLLLDFWPLRRIRIKNSPPSDAKHNEEIFATATPARLLLEKIPLFVLAMISGVITIIGHQRLGLLTPTERLSVAGRVFFTLVSYLAYLNKAVWPTRLSVFYPMPTDLPFWEILEAGLVLLLVTYLAVKSARSRPYLLMGWLWFLGTLVPVVGILQVSQQAMADRWAYVPLIGLFIMLAWGLPDLFACWRIGKAALPALTVATLIVLAVVAHVQVAYWQNSETLFKHALDVTKDNHVAYLNYGNALAARGDYIGAAANFDELLRIQPHSGLAHLNRAALFATEKKYDEAIAEFQLTIRDYPTCPRGHLNWGNTLALQKKYDEAMEQYHEELRVDPNSAEAYGNMGNVYFLQGDIPRALEQLETAIRINPALPEKQYLLAGLRARQKQFDQAVVHYRESIKYRKNDASALNDLAWILATADDPKVYNAAQALPLSRRACELTKRQDAGYLDTLAVACSETGRLIEASKTAREAMAVARASGNEPLAQKIQEHLQYFEQNQTYRAANRANTITPAKP